MRIYIPSLMEDYTSIMGGIFFAYMTSKVNEKCKALIRAESKHLLSLHKQMPTQ